MQVRTIEDVFSKELGHKRFARFIKLAQNDGITITDIKEYNEKFKFVMNGHPVEYDKATKDVRGMYLFARATIEMRGKL